MNDFAAGFIFLLVIMADTRYCWLAFHSKKQPSLTTWIIFAAATLVSILTYATTNRVGVATAVRNNPLNAVDIVATWTVSGILFFRTRKPVPFGSLWKSNRERHGTAFAILKTVPQWLGESFSFTCIEKFCLSATATIGIAWFFLGYLVVASALSNVAVQVVMVIAYAPTYEKLRGAKTVTEPAEVWAAHWLANAIGLTSAIASGSILPAVYAGRALILISILIVFVHRAKKRVSVST